MSEFSNILGSYWTSYGGWGAFFRSPFILIASIAAAITTYDFLDGNWSDLAIQIVPAVLGFTLGGYAILVSFAASDFRNAMMGRFKDGTQSPLMEINSAFFHFFVFQSATFLFAFICIPVYKHSLLDIFLSEIPGWLIATNNIILVIITFFGAFLLIYTMLMVLATAMRIYSVLEDFDTMFDGRDQSQK